MTITAWWILQGEWRRLAGRERKNGRTLAENAGAVSPDGMQRLLRTADWDVDVARDDLCGDILDQVGDDATGVFILDETRFIKNGVRSGRPRRVDPVVGQRDPLLIAECRCRTRSCATTW